MKRVGATSVVLVLALIHIGWGLARVPGKVLSRRIGDVRAYREQGPTRYLLENNGMGGAEALQWVREHTPEHCVVLWTGDPKGALEFAPSLIAPRLVIPIGACPPGAQDYAGLPLAIAEHGGRRGRVLLIGSPDGITVEVR
ncbi:MAG: hypothetical protein H6838_10300 [Planctomycetes bacterium]|nr:hypothetical protein [Planctomycetota bacterium]MCB9885875.1 hypothetical protein [Planctomycetota bacterium]